MQLALEPGALGAHLACLPSIPLQNRAQEWQEGGRTAGDGSLIPLAKNSHSVNRTGVPTHLLPKSAAELQGCPRPQSEDLREVSLGCETPLGWEARSPTACSQASKTGGRLTACSPTPAEAKVTYVHRQHFCSPPSAT